MILTLSVNMMNIVLTLGLSSNKKVTGELILVCSERWFTHEQVALETLHNWSIEDAPSRLGDEDEVIDLPQCVLDAICHLSACEGNDLVTF